MELNRKNFNRMLIVMMVSLIITMVLTETLRTATGIALLSTAWLFAVSLTADALLKERDEAAAKRDANRALALAAVEEMIVTADRLAAICKDADPVTPSNWHLQNKRWELVRKFIYKASELNVTWEEMLHMLDRTLQHIDPMVLRDAVDDMTASDTWPNPAPQWKVDLMTYVRRGSNWPQAELGRFEASLAAYRSR